MSAHVGPLPAFVVGYLLAAALGGAALLWLTRRSGYSTADSVTILVYLTVALLIGSKALYLVEAWPLWAIGRAELSQALFSPRMRIPGGLLLAIAVGPWIARSIGCRFLSYADTVIPAAGVLLVGIRIGCFLEGCCFGTPTELPWSVRFPPGTDVIAWQRSVGIIAANEMLPHPVHPLQLYFAAVGLALFVALSWYAPRKRYEGEILALFGIAYFWSTWLLEWLRAFPHSTTRNVVLGCALVCTMIAIYSHQWAPRSMQRAGAVS